MNKPFCVGITGGIGSGKTALTDRLAARGITIVDADLTARAVVEKGQPALETIAEHFGPDMLLDDGSLDRATLRKVVFADPAERAWLEGLTHPLIGARIQGDLEAADSPYVVLSSPLLLEGKQKDLVDYIVVVDVPEATQLARTTRRDNNSEALVRSIMAAQLAREDRLNQADWVVDNSGDLADLDRAAADLHDQLLREAQKANDAS